MATRWSVSLNRQAEKELKNLVANDLTDVLEDAFAVMLELEEDHCPPGCTPLREAKDLYRARIAGNYRMVYRVSKQHNTIQITRIRHRETAYKGL